ncbi:MAG: bacterioferritin [Proteobacteria bacterium]|nr:bacterioferritin [Pseudomonadota bacterium]
MPAQTATQARKSAPTSGNGRAPAAPQESGFLSDVKALRERVRQHIDEGAVTPNYGADRDKVVALLNAALATEIVCVLRYKRHYFMAQGIASDSVKAEFLEHAGEEQEHADEIAERICQLGGEPDLDPEGLASRSHSEYVAGTSLREMVREDLIAERVAIESYREMINYIGDRDTTTKRMLEHILAVEEEHAEDMNSLLQGIKD